MKRYTAIFIALALLAPLAMTACGGGGGGSSPELTATYIFTSTDTPLGIPDDYLPGVSSEINVPAVIGTINKVTVQVNISHTWLDDLTLILFSPDGTSIYLAEYAGMDGNNFNSTVFDDNATESIYSGSAPFKGVYRPDEPLWNFIGENPAGSWYLVVIDDYFLDVGTLNWWKIGLD